MVTSDCRLPAVGLAGEPHEPALDQQVGARLRLELAPQRARAAGGGGVVGVPAVAAADQARLAARGGAAVAGLELVDERDLHAVARQPPRERGAERPRADDDDRVHDDRGRYRAAGARPGCRHRVAPVRPLRRSPAAARRARGGGSGEGAGRRLDPRQRDRRARGDLPPAPLDAARRRRAVARRHGQPRRRAPRHAPERARRRPQPQLRPPLGRWRARVRHLLPGPERVLGAGVARGAAARAPAAPGGDGLVPPAHAAGEPVRRRRPAGGPRLRAPRRPARAPAPALPRHRHRLAEPHVPRHERVRGRAARRPAERRLGPPPRARRPGGRDPRPPPRPPRARTSSGAASPSAPNAAPRPAPTPSATTARARTASNRR